MKAITSSLSSEFPEIAKEWHPTKNGDLTPDMISPHSNKEVWWLCPYGHTYSQTVDKRTGRGYGCSYCSGKRVLPGFNDLATKMPGLAAEWDHNRNVPLTPQSVTCNSHKKVWWKCSSCGHEWQATVNDRYRDRGCPICAVSARTSARLKTMTNPGVNDLASQRPDLLSEWSLKNGDADPKNYTLNSSYKAWWKCPVCGNEWQASVKNRAVNNSGCPRCMRHKGTSFPEQALFYYFKMVFPNAVNGYMDGFGSTKMELDIFVPDIKTGIEYDGIAWHSNTKSQKRDEKKYRACQESRIKLIRVSEIPGRDSQFCDCFVFRKNSSSKSLNDAITEALAFCGVLTRSVDTERDRAEIMRQYITTLREKSIATKYPDAVKEWDVELNDGLTADMVSAVSNVKFWWRCENGHPYQSTPANKLPYNYGCPYCSNHRLWTGFNDLETRFPELAKEWDYQKNSPIKPSDIIATSSKKYWWLCSKGHSFSVSPGNRIQQSSGCPYCSNTKVLKGYNDLETTRPAIAAMWDYEKNKDLTPNTVTAGSNKKAWWKCEYGHSFEKTISLQVKSPVCPYCHKRSSRTR